MGVHHAKKHHRVAKKKHHVIKRRTVKVEAKNLAANLLGSMPRAHMHHRKKKVLHSKKKVSHHKRVKKLKLKKHAALLKPKHKTVQMVSTRISDLVHSHKVHHKKMKKKMHKKKKKKGILAGLHLPSADDVVPEDTEEAFTH